MTNVLDELNIKMSNATQPMVQEGATLKDRFVLESKIGSGGVGIIYKARDKRKEEAGLRNPYVAIKIVNEHYRNHPQIFKTLQLEAAKAQAIAHPNIVRIYDFDRDGDIAFISMEFLEGQTLKQMLNSNALQHLHQTQKLALITELGAALIYMHQQGYAHADLKPSNIFITNHLQIKLIDFGFSQTTPLAPDQDSILTYSPLYASYEILNGNPATQSDDVYALACVAYELLTGHHPYKKKSAQEANQQQLVLTPITSLNKKQWKVLQKGLALQRKDRYPTVSEFLQAFTKAGLPWWQTLFA